MLHGLTFPSPAGEHKVHKYGGLTLCLVGEQVPQWLLVLPWDLCVSQCCVEMQQKGEEGGRGDQEDLRRKAVRGKVGESLQTGLREGRCCRGHTTGR